MEDGRQTALRLATHVPPSAVMKPRRSSRFALAVAMTTAAPATLWPDAGGGLEVGDSAPHIALHEVLQAPHGIRPDSAPRPGRVTVLEFWATWCAPCIASFSHLEQIAAELAGEPVDFLLVTDESVEIAERFLDRQSVPGWVGIDASGEVFRAYDVRWRPRTVVIGKAGRITALTQPDLLSAYVLREIAAGRPVVLRDPLAEAAAESKEACCGASPASRTRSTRGRGTKATPPTTPESSPPRTGTYAACPVPWKGSWAYP